MKFRLALTLLASLAMNALPTAHAQSSCSSDGQARPVALLERFISADCEECWSDTATAKPARGVLALDWIVPGSKGDDAPLSAAASRDSLERLQALGTPAPARVQVRQQRVIPRGGAALRVAHGLPFNDYIAASIAQKPPGRGAQTAWLVLVETIPAGTDGTPVARNLVRNVLVTPWDRALLRTRAERERFFESRSMSIPANAKAERLRVVGWVQDKQGRITSIAQSFCPAAS
jgi:hypothetical protein